MDDDTAGRVIDDQREVAENKLPELLPECGRHGISGADLFYPGLAP